MSLVVQILIGAIPVIISSIVAYYKSKNDMQIKIYENEKNAESLIQRIETEYDGKVRFLKEQRKTDLEFYKGMIDIKKLEDENNKK